LFFFVISACVPFLFDTFMTRYLFNPKKDKYELQN